MSFWFVGDVLRYCAFFLSINDLQRWPNWIIHIAPLLRILFWILVGSLLIDVYVPAKWRQWLKQFK